MKKSFFGTKSAWVAALAGSALIAASSSAQTASPQPTTQTLNANSTAKNQSAGLLKAVARNNDMEIALTEVGARKAQNPDLKQFCQQAQPEQIQINEQLKPVAHQHGVTIDRPLTKKDEAELSKLQFSNATTFDRTLASLLVTEEGKNLRDLQQASAQPAPADVQQYVQQTLPKARQEFSQAQAAAKELGLNPLPGSKRHAPKTAGGAGEIH